MIGSPEELLRSALEKIVFFECRVASLEGELSAARSAAARARELAGGGRRRESDLEQEGARLRAEHAASVGQNAELSERVRLLEAERERFLSGMVERARVAGAPVDEDGEAGDSHELAGFIAELRAEIEELRAWKRTALAAGLKLADPGPEVPEQAMAPGEVQAESGGSRPTVLPLRSPASEPAAVRALAGRFLEAHRIGLSREEERRVPAFSTRSERALYEASLDDLAASDPGVRRRAADGLRALGSRSAAPLLAAALGREPEAEVKLALLAALGVLAERGAAELALRELLDARPEVRAAALEAASALDPGGVAPRLAAALGDESALVRRRAAMLLGFTSGDLCEEALAGALTDREAGVARAAASALSGRPSARAQGALVRALEHRERSVRVAAARAVGRWCGEAIDVDAPEPERRRAARRAADRLLTLGEGELRRAVTRVRAEAARAPRALAPLSPGSGARPAAPRPAAPVDAALTSAALAEVRTALRGRTAEEIAAALAREPAQVTSSLAALVAQGAVVARGPRYFVG